MPMPIAIHPVPLPQPWVARLWARIQSATAGWAGTSRPAPAAQHRSQRARAEDEALAGLSEHMLKDIGASSRLLANAASRSRDGCAAAIDPGLF